jgi:hypothetical protein
MTETKWRDQCRAARRIHDEFGLEKALGYLVGEKLLAFVRVSDRQPALRTELPDFVAEIRSVFTRSELEQYFATIHRVGPAAHVLDAEAYEFMRDAGAFGEEDVVSAAQDAILIERARALLLAVGGTSNE